MTGIMNMFVGNVPSGGGIVTSGLVMYLDAGNSSSYPGSGSTWYDLSGNGYNGSITNNPPYSTSNGGYFTFNGSNQYVSFSTYSQPAYATTTSFTWCIWVYPPRNNNVDVLMGSRGTDLDFTKLTTNNFEYYPTNLGGAMPLNTWQNVCAVKNQTSFTYYRNLSSIATASSSTTKPSKPFYIGGDPTATEYSTSRIAIVLVYNKALSTDEMTKNYDFFKDRYGL